jgi:hypothetical protein
MIQSGEDVMRPRVATQQWQASALWNWLKISLPRSNNYPSVLVLAQQISKEKEKQKKNRAEEQGERIYYWLLYNDLPTKNTSLETRSCRGIWTMKSSVLKPKRSGCLPPCPRWQLCPFHWSYWQLLERRPWTNRRLEGHCTEARMLVEISSLWWKQLLWESRGDPQG